ncbi:MAG TPA: UbiA family prenyltransferase, partial [Candidatus Synoicihabitans sp.]|nr:UbiA family prenyltransferase [Candidatus Synoicihabitans sp.]
SRYTVAFVVSLASFMLLRIADEFKDAEEDARYRPYRPVPRGLVTLRELKRIGIALAVLQAASALALSAIAPAATGFDLRLLGLLVLAWVYFALMSHEFFAREWLKARPVVYLFSHMGIMPLVDWFATGCDWVPAGVAMPRGLFWFLAASFCNGLVIELGRKIRTPAQEEPGVDTYTRLWGQPIAVGAWLTALAATFACAWVAGQRIGFAPMIGSILGLLFAGALLLAIAFLRSPHQGKLAKSFEAAAALWTLALYVSLGVIPLLVRP